MIIEVISSQAIRYFNLLGFIYLKYMFTISVNISMIIQREYHQEMMIRLLGDGLYQLYHILYYDIVNLLISSIMIVDNLSRDVLRFFRYKRVDFLDCLSKNTRYNTIINIEYILNNYTCSVYPITHTIYSVRTFYEYFAFSE